MAIGTVMADFLRGSRDIDPDRNRRIGQKTELEELVDKHEEEDKSEELYKHELS